MSDQDLRATEDHEHEKEVRFIKIQRLAAIVELEILSDPETFAEWINHENFANHVAMIVSAAPDDAALGHLIRLKHKSAAKLAAHEFAERQIDGRMT